MNEKTATTLHEYINDMNANGKFTSYNDYLDLWYFINDLIDES